MDIRFTARASEAEMKPVIFSYYRYYFRNGRVLYWLLALTLLACVLEPDIEVSEAVFLIVLLLVYLFLPYVNFVVYWRRMREMFRLRHYFELPVEWHLTDDKFATVCGESQGEAPYRDIFTHYLLENDQLILLQQKHFAATVGRSDFPSPADFDEFIAVLEKNGIKPAPRKMSKWVAIFMLLQAAILIFIWYRTINNLYYCASPWFLEFL